MNKAYNALSAFEQVAVQKENELLNALVRAHASHAEYLRCKIDHLNGLVAVKDAAFKKAVQAEALRDAAAEIRESISHSDVDDHRFEDGKESVANWLELRAEAP